MNMEIDIIEVEKMSVGLFIIHNIEATKITSDWYLWIHHTTDRVPSNKDKKYKWQKSHLENQTGTKNSFKPVKIRKDVSKKNMKPGNKISFISFLLFLFSNFLFANEKITTSPLLNIDEIKPSFEEQKLITKTQILVKI